MFDWDGNNLRKIRAHRISRDEAEQALLNDPMPVYDQSLDGEIRYVYYGETDSGRLLAIVLTERGDAVRVVTAYELDAGQRRSYHTMRMKGNSTT